MPISIGDIVKRAREKAQPVARTRRGAGGVARASIRDILNRARSASSPVPLAFKAAIPSAAVPPQFSGQRLVTPQASPPSLLQPSQAEIRTQAEMERTRKLSIPQRIGEAFNRFRKGAPARPSFTPKGQAFPAAIDFLTKGQKLGPFEVTPKTFEKLQNERQREIEKLQKSGEPLTQDALDDAAQRAERRATTAEQGALFIMGLYGGGKRKVVKGAIEKSSGKFVSTAPKETKDISIKGLKLTPKAEKKLTQVIDDIKPELEALRGKPLTKDEVLQAAKTSDILRKTTTRADTLRREATLLKTRQELAKMAEGGEVTDDFVALLKNVRAEKTALGRQLQALQTTAEPGAAGFKLKMIEDLATRLDDQTDEILKAAKGVDFTDAEQVTKFYRTFVKPSYGELIDEFRYINLLSSPKTHIVNAFSNVLQTTVLRPATKLYSGGVDKVYSKLSGKEQQYYASEVPAYYKGLYNSLDEAWTGALKAYKGNTILARPDVAHIPTGNRFLKPFQRIPRALEAGDVFFRTLIRGGEKEALMLRALKQGKTPNLTEIADEAEKIAQEFVFRKALDPQNATGQGRLLSYIDDMTSGLYKMRKGPMKWFVPFVQTPMNIFKQGIEFSPVGFATLPGSTRKIEQLSRALVGTTVFGGASILAFNDRLTWATPTDPSQRQAFFDAGMQPYSVRVGDKWISFSKLGPLAYPMAMAAAVKYYIEDNPESVTDTQLEKTTKVLSGIAEFFSDQSYVQGVGDFVDALRGEEGAIQKVITGFPSQVVPLSSLQRWVTQGLDPIYRKGKRELSLEAIVDNLKKGIPGLSFQVEPYRTGTGEPSRRPLRFLNLVSPLQIGEFKPEEIEKYQGVLNKKKLNKIKNNPEDFILNIRKMGEEERSAVLKNLYEQAPEVHAKLKEASRRMKAKEQIESLQGQERVAYIADVIRPLSESGRKAFLKELWDEGLTNPEIMQSLRAQF